MSRQIVKMKQIEHTICEKRILSCISFPLIVNLNYSFKVIIIFYDSAHKIGMNFLYLIKG